MIDIRPERADNDPTPTRGDRKMKEVMTLVKSPILRGGFIAYAEGNLIATVAKVTKNDNDSHFSGQYRICFTRGKLQGKIAYAPDIQEINDRICAVIEFAK